MNHSLSEHEQNAIRKVCNFTQISLNYEQHVFYALDNITVIVLEIQPYAFCTAAGYGGRLPAVSYCGNLLQQVTAACYCSFCGSCSVNSIIATGFD